MHELLFSSVCLIHSTPNRARFRYRTRTRFNPDVLIRYLELQDGIQHIRINPHAASIIVSIDETVLEIEDVGYKLSGININKLEAISGGKMMENNPFTPETAIPLLRPGIALVASPFLPPALNLMLSLIATFPALRHGAELLFSRGVTSEVLEAGAIAISLYRQDFFAANTTNFLIEAAEVIEENIERKSDAMLQSLLTPKISTVWVEREGEEIQVESNRVQIGDAVIASAGETIPVDGTVIDGDALVNQVSMTGESVPVRKVRGDRAISGTVIEEGRIRIWAEHVGEETATFRISEYVQSSLQSKSNMQLDANKLADNLVPITLGLSAFTYATSQDITRVAAVIQADYSCALKLATPVAFKSSMFKAGAHGILIKGADTLERLAEADTFVFDKTGTLTSGDLEVNEIYSLDPEWSKQEVLSLAASIEEHYFHPVAEAVVKAAQACNDCDHFNHSEVEFIVAHGVAAEVEGKKVVIGSRHFLEEDEGICFQAQYGFIDEQYKAGNTLLYIGYDRKLLGMLSLKDQVREESARSLQWLRDLGAKEIIMLTGDHRERADEMAEKLAIDRCYSELLPEQKAEIVEQLKAEGKKVVFVGDGINDAPSLSAAHVGIAMQKGADIARVTSDIALLEDRLSAVPEAKEIAIKAVELVQSNYRWTVGANTAILGGAAIGLFSPVATSLLHNGTTIGILLKALRGVQLDKEPKDTVLEEAV